MAELTYHQRMRAAARCYLKSGMLDEACDRLEKAEAWSAAAELHQRAGRWHTAGECHFTGGDWRAAVRCLERAGSWEAVALVLSRSGEAEAAGWVFVSKLGHRARAEQAIAGLEGWGPHLIRVACRARQDPAGCRASVEAAREGIAAGSIPVELAERAVWVAEAVGRPDLALAVFAAARPHLDRRWPGWSVGALGRDTRWPWGAIGPEPEAAPTPVDLPRTERRPRMVWLTGGDFRMGGMDAGKYGDELPVHDVWLSPFWMAATTVTQGQYASVMGENPSDFTGDDRRPVESVDWFDAVRFCNALSRAEGLRPVYDEETWAWDASADGYRLPTEAEWEYACRAGSDSAWWVGDDEGRLAEVAWYGEGIDGQTHPVGLKRPNPFGLYDTHGNVREWCWDRWADRYPAEPQRDPLGPPTGDRRVYRGGSGWGGARFTRSAYRLRYPPDYRDVDLGFRLPAPPRDRFLNLDP